MDIDNNGNRMIISSSGGITLLLKGQRPKNIGSISFDGECTNYVKDDKESQIFRKNNSWSLCSEVLKYVNGTVTIKTKLYDYKISIEDIKVFGTYLWFLNQGYERKIYVPLAYWKKQSLTSKKHL